MSRCAFMASFALIATIDRFLADGQPNSIPCRNYRNDFLQWLLTATSFIPFPPPTYVKRFIVLHRSLYLNAPIGVHVNTRTRQRDNPLLN
jgi:hypothetical protein